MEKTICATKALQDLFNAALVPADIYQLSADVSLVIHMTFVPETFSPENLTGPTICDLRIKDGKTQKIYRVFWENQSFNFRVYCSESLPTPEFKLNEGTLISVLEYLLKEYGHKC